jgi:hypothetical protein
MFFNCYLKQKITQLRIFVFIFIKLKNEDEKLKKQKEKHAKLKKCVVIGSCVLFKTKQAYFF